MREFPECVLSLSMVFCCGANELGQMVKKLKAQEHQCAWMEGKDIKKEIIVVW